MVKKELTFNNQNPFPVALNTTHDEMQLLASEVRENLNVLRLPSGELTTHPYWPSIPVYVDGQLLSGKIIKMFLVDNIYIQRQFLVFGIQIFEADVYGFIGRIYASDISIEPDVEHADMTILLDNLNKNIIPCFACYKEGVYITLGSQGIYYYDGTDTLVNKSTESGGDLDDIYAYVGAVFRSRLWLAGLVGDPGKVKITKIGLEEIDTDILCGDNSEIITGSMPKENSIIFCKNQAIYEFEYTSLTTGTLHTLSEKIGCISHTTLQKEFDMTYFLGQSDVCVINPRYIKASGREVVIDPNVINISEPIKDSIKNLPLPQSEQKTYSKTTFSYDDFLWHENITIYPDPAEIIRITKSAKYEDQNYYGTSNLSIIIKQGYNYWMSFKPTKNIIGTDVYVKLAKTQNASGTKLRISICHDDAGQPGNVIVSKEWDTSGWSLGAGWAVFQLELEPGAPFTFDKDTSYHILLENLSTATNYIWYGHYPGTYSRGQFGSSDPEYYGWANTDMYFIFMGEYYNKDDASYCISGEVTLEGIDSWQSFNVSEVKPSETNMVYHIREYDEENPDTGWVLIDPGDPIPAELQYVEKLQWKATFTSTDYTKTPLLEAVYFYGVAYQNSDQIISSGYRENRYYLLGTVFGDPVVYSKNGWLNVRPNQEAVCYQCFDDITMNNINIVGGGSLDERMCLFYALYSYHADYLNTSISIISGKILMDELPKKLRKVFVDYCGNDVSFVVTAKDGEHSFTLDDAIDFTIKEINTGSDRTQWIKYQFGATKNFKLKELSISLKLFKPNE